MRGADGVNLDFEPIVSGYDDEFTALVRRVRTELDAVQPGYYLTFATTGFIGNYPIEAATAAGGADAIMIMGYDYRNAGSSTVGSIAPLSGPMYDITDTINAYAARVPARAGVTCASATDEVSRSRNMPKLRRALRRSMVVPQKSTEPLATFDRSVGSR